MGFTGQLILAQAEVPLTELEPLAGCNIELVGGRDDGWQLAALVEDVRGAFHVAVLLVDATAAPVLVADVEDSQCAWLVAESPKNRRWQAWLNGALAAAGGDPEEFATTMGTERDAVAWVTEAGKAAEPQTVLEAMSAADRETQATSKAWTDAQGDTEALAEIMRNQTSFVEIHILRVLAALGFAVRAAETDSWWGHLVRKSQTN